MTPDLVAVVLGGSGHADPLAKEAGVAAKALVPLLGRPMASYVLEALRDSASVSDTVYVGETTPDLRALAARTLNSGEHLADSLSLGLSAALEAQPERVLVLSADLPWLSAETVDAFVMGAARAAPEAAVTYPIIPKEVAEGQFPGQRRTYARLKEGAFTGGNAMLLEPRVLPTLLPFVNRAYAGRKNPFSLAGLVGVRFALQLLTGTLRIAALERRISEILTMPARAYRSQDAALGADVDKPEHIGAFIRSRRQANLKGP